MYRLYLQKCNPNASGIPSYPFLNESPASQRISGKKSSFLRKTRYSSPPRPAFIGKFYVPQKRRGGGGKVRIMKFQTSLSLVAQPVRSRQRSLIFQTARNGKLTNLWPGATLGKAKFVQFLSSNSSPCLGHNQERALDLHGFRLRSNLALRVAI